MIEKEAELMKRVDHPQIMKLVDYSNNGTFYNHLGEATAVHYFVMEMCPEGELFDLVYQTGGFAERYARFYFKQLIDIIEYLQNNKICHRDIKTQNILLDENFNLKLIDFGWSDIGINFSERAGTPECMAPEVLKSEEYNGLMADLWSVAGVLMCLVAHVPPFEKADPEQDKLYRYLAKGQLHKFWDAHNSWKHPDNFTPDFMSIITTMLYPDAGLRMTIADIKSHPFYTADTADAEEVREEIMRRLGRTKKLADDESFPDTSTVAASSFDSDTKRGGESGEGTLHLPRVANKLYPGGMKRFARFYSKSAIDELFKTLGLVREAYTKDFEFSPDHYKVKLNLGKEFSVSIEILEVEGKGFCIDFLKLKGGQKQFTKFFMEAKNMFRGHVNLAI